MKIANDLGKPITGRAVISKKEAVEDCLKISVFDLRRSGRFKGLRQGPGQPLVNIDFQGIRDSIGLEGTACYFGGVRWWFVCPGCGGRKGILYKPYYASFFRCRHCHNLAYLSTQIRRNHWELIFQAAREDGRLIRLLEGVGQKGFSKPELMQLQKSNGRNERLYEKLIRAK